MTTTSFTLARGTLTLAGSPPARVRVVVVAAHDGTVLHEGADVGPDGRFVITLPADPCEAWRHRGVRDLSFIAQIGAARYVAGGAAGEIAWPLDKLPLEDLLLRVGAGIEQATQAPVAFFNSSAAVVELEARLLGQIEDRLSRIDQKLGALGGAGSQLALHARGADVQALQSDLAKLGQDIPAAESAAQVFGPGTRDALLAFQAKQGLPLTGLLDGSTQAALANGVAEVSQRSYRAEGRILLESGAPAAKLQVRLYSQGFGGAAKLLGQASTDEHGYYSLPYDPGKQAANLEVRTVDAGGKEVSISSTKWGAGKYEVLNLVAPAAVQPLAAEYQRLTADVGKEIDDLAALGGAREDDERRDLTLLYQATGWDARLLALAATAQKQSTATRIPVDVLYGLFRVGLPTDAGLLALTHPDTIDQALRKAQDAGIVHLTDAQLAGAKTAFATFARTARLALKPAGMLSSAGDFLARAGLEGAQKDTFASLYLAERATGAELWQKAKAAGIPQATIDSLRLQGKLAHLTINNVDLVTSLQGEIGSPDNLAALVDKDLHQGSAWTARLRALAGNDDQKLAELIPPAYAGDKVADRLDAYAADLARRVRLAFPMQVVGRRVADDQQLGKHHGALKGPVSAFLAKAADAGFMLGRTSLDAFVRDHRKSLFPPETSEKAFQDTLDAARRLQRLYQVTPSDEALQAAYDLGFTSAYEIASFPHQVFVDRFIDAFPPGEAQLVHRKATQISSVTYGFFATAKSLDNTPALYATSPADAPAKVADAKNNLIEHFPTMETLFGSLDFCECEECRSVLSPAAYLVDLLQFIDPEDQPWNNFLSTWQSRHGGDAYMKDWTSPGGGARDGQDKRPYDALVERRPDLPCLPLTCENTNTALPYIDVVNEVLEYYVSKNGLDQGAAYDTGAATTPELLAEPQNVLTDVYDTTLKQARYPLTLPFDLWIETARRFFEHGGTSLAEILELLRPSDDLLPPPQSPKPYYRADIFAEQLGISPSERSIFTDPSPLTAWFGLYGFTTEAAALTEATDDSGQRVDLRSAKALSRRLGVTYKELVLLVQTWFVNPRLDGLSLLWKLGIDVGDVLHYEDPTAPPADIAAFEQRLAALSAKFAAVAFDAKGWLDAAWQKGDFKQVLVLAAPDTGCDFDKTTLQYADGTPADALVFLKINLFVRLWKKLGWTIEETDRALRALVPSGSLPLTGASLGAALQTAILHLAHLEALEARLHAGKDGRSKLLTLWSAIPTTGAKPLYEQLFLTQGVLESDPVFDDPLGNYLSKGGVLLGDHLIALQGALNLTAGDVKSILDDAHLDLATASLDLATVSLLYRHGLLAKALELSVSDLITLKSLSGLDPFAPVLAGPVTTLADDHPFSQTLAFLDVVDAVRASGFKVEDLDYLLRHRFDPVGKYRASADAPLALVRTLATEIGRIRSDNAVPADAALITDDWLRQKLALALPPDVLDTFFGMWNGTVEYRAPLADAATADALVATAASQSPPVRVSYDAVLQELTFHAVLVDAQKAALSAAFPTLAGLLDGVQDQAKAFFEQQLQTHDIGAGVVGFLAPGDFTTLFAPVPAGLSDADQQQLIGSRRMILAQAFLPYLQRRLVQGYVAETLAAALDADAALTESLLTDATLLHDPAAPAVRLLDAFAAVAGAEQQGVSAAFFASTDATGAPLAAATLAGADTAANVVGSSVAGKPGGARSAKLQAYFEVPTSGPFRLYAVLGKAGTGADLRVGDLPDPVLRGTAASDNTEISGLVQLDAGVLYPITLEVHDLGGGDVRIEILGESLPRGSLSQLELHSATAVESVRRAWVVTSKTLQITEGFALSNAEVSYLLTHAADFDGLAPSGLPTTEADATPTTAEALLQQLLRLAAYQRLKRALAGGTDDLVSVFQNARRAYPADASPDTAREEVLADLAARVASLARRDDAVVRAAADQLGFTASATVVGGALEVEALDFTTEKGLGRLWDVLQMVEVLGVPVEALARWATPAPGSSTAHDLRDTVKARYEPESWQLVAPSIFDKLRQKKRDALVAYIMHKNGFDRIEQLFEYFLIDPGMEPVVQTSRLRLALSSVQTFVQRCLLNLEVHVHPSAILDADRWQWMKRYRVWEANRKIFLFPENWLEPEWRDDKTHLFQELEGALLQGDVSSELVEDAFFRYLRGLDEIARLEIVTTYLEEKDDLATDVLHVIGRTHGRPHKYFYRRYTKEMWTPWEPVTVEIDSDHLVAAVWRDRLHLFWVTFFPKSDVNADAVPEGTGAAASTLPLKSVVAQTSQVMQRYTQLQLSWSEYFQGQWTPRSASEFSPATPIPVTSFEWDGVFIHLSKEYVGDVEEAVKVHLNGPSIGIDHAFRLVSKNSQPTIEAAEEPQWPPYDVDAYVPSTTRYDASGALTVELIEKIETEDGQSPTYTWLAPQILGQGEDYSLLLPSNPLSLIAESGDDIGMLTAPFFYQDAHNSFYVEPTLTETTSERWEDWVVTTPTPGPKPVHWWDNIPITAYVPQTPVIKRPDPGDPAYDHSIYEVGNPGDWMTNPAAALTFGDRLIGQGGAIAVSADRTAAVGGAGVLAKVGGAGLTAGLLRGVNTQIAASTSGARAGAAVGFITG